MEAKKALSLLAAAVVLSAGANYSRAASSDENVIQFAGEFLSIPGGSFLMGSNDGDDDEKPVRAVTVPAFRLGKTEVTVAQFRQFVNETSYVTQAEANADGSEGCYGYDSTTGELRNIAGRNWRNPGFEQRDTSPVVCVSWVDVQEYLAWLNGKSDLKFRLPTEAEWEYAARAGSTGRYSFGDDSSQLCRHANGTDETPVPNILRWYNPAHCRDGYGARTAPVASFAANALGLYDMHGNVWEWTQDCWNASYNGAPADGSAWTTGDCELAVVRGGAWNNSPDRLRSANRNWGVRANRNPNYGFRLAQDN